MSFVELHDSKKIKATRTSAPKSRRGCVICKARHIKCDESRPQCKSCVKNGQHCRYLDAWSNSSSKDARSFKIKPKESTLNQARPSQALNFVDQREVSFFWAYQDEAVRELTYTFKSSPWCSSMLQACHTEPFVLRAIVAIGALNKSFKMADIASKCPPALQKVHQDISSQHRTFALASYEKAIVGMRKTLHDPRDPSNLRSMLIACLLIFCMEHYLHSSQTAALQLSVGHNLMRQWISENDYQQNTGLSSPNASVIEDDLFREISRMSALYARVEGPLWIHTKWKEEASEAVKNMPQKFSSLEEAAVYQELIVRRSDRFVGEVTTRIAAAKLELGHAETADSPNDIIDQCFLPMMLLPERDGYLRDLRRWFKIVQPMIGSFLASADPKEAIGASKLMIDALHTEVGLAGAFFTEACSYDDFMPQYKTIIDLSQNIARRRNELFPSSLPNFQLTPGPTAGLYMTAVVCRDPVLRREALSMLHQEAEKDLTKIVTKLLAHARYIVALEEKGRKNGLLPETSRYRGMLIWEWSGDHHMFVCARTISYPIGKRYPAKREWRAATFSIADIDAMTTGETTETTWPPGVAKPNFLKWQELHVELLDVTSDVRNAIDVNDRNMYRPLNPS